MSCLSDLAAAYGGGSPIQLRLVFSRDELRTRLPAVPPLLVQRGARRVLMPRDADAGGTWIAVNDAGVVFALLNLHTGDQRGHGTARGSPRRRTRGVVIEALVEAANATEALKRTNALDARAFRPFRVMACDRHGFVTEAVSDGASISRRVRHLDGPLMRTSSSLGDAVVIGPRRALFRRLIGDSARPTAPMQDAFHDHYWPGARELSVRMSRRNARTVSITTVELRDGGVRMLYRELADVRADDRVPPGTPVGLHTQPTVAGAHLNA